MPKEIPNKRYTAEFKQQAVELMQKDGLSYTATTGRFEICDNKRAAAS